MDAILKASLLSAAEDDARRLERVAAGETIPFYNVYFCMIYWLYQRLRW